MSTVLAAIDGSATSRCVLAVAREVGRVLGARVDAIHVVEGENRPPDVEILGGDAPLRIVEGDVSERLVAEASATGVVAVVVGSSRTVGGARPAGHVTLDVIGKMHRPVVVVPPVTSAAFELHTVLVPVQGKPARALEEVIRLAENPKLQLVILRLLDEWSIPAFEDQPYYDVETWAEEFLARWVPGASSDTVMEVRIGAPEELILTVAREVTADMVAIGWRQDVGTERSPVVRTALERSPIPVVLLPLASKDRVITLPPDVESVT